MIQANSMIPQFYDFTVISFVGARCCFTFSVCALSSLLTPILPHVMYVPTCLSPLGLSRICSKFASMSPEAVRAAILLTLVVQNSAQAIFMRYSFKPKDQV